MVQPTASATADELRAGLAEAVLEAADVLGLGLTRIGGHPECFRERCHHARNPSSVFA